MKLPKCGDKFVITEKTSLFYGNVVSGVHLEIWGSEDYPDKLFYHVCVNQAYGGDIISCYGGFVCAFLTLKEALEYVSHYLTPYQEQEEKAEEGLIVEKENSDGQEKSDRRGRSEGYSRVQEETGLLDTTDHDGSKYAGRRHTPIGTAKDTLGVTAHLGGVSFA